MRACERGGGGVCAARDRLASRRYGCRVAQINTLVRTAARSMPRRRPPPRRCLPPRPRPGLACALRSPAHRPARVPPYVAGPLGPPATGLRPLIPRPPLLWGGYHYAAQFYWNAAPRLGPVGSYPGSWCAPAALGAPPVAPACPPRNAAGSGLTLWAARTRSRHRGCRAHLRESARRLEPRQAARTVPCRPPPPAVLARRPLVLLRRWPL